jgi:transcriptional regulator with XRE-family HTH domain
VKRIHLRKARESKQLTQQQLADKLGWPQSKISALETTIENPTIDTVRALAEELEIDPLALTFGQSEAVAP